MEWVVAAVGVALAGLVAVLLISRRKLRGERAAALANQMVRRPERILLDLPLFLGKVLPDQRHSFLMQTEKELGHMGTLSAHRDFVTRYAEVVKAQSAESLGQLGAFISHKDQHNFRETLVNDRKCEAAVRFFELVDLLMDAARDERRIEFVLADLRKKFPKARTSVHKPSMKSLEGDDIAVVEEYKKMMKALHKLIEPSGPDKKDGPKKHRRRGYRGAHSDTSEAAAPRALSDPEETPFLESIQTAARELYLNGQQAFLQ